LKSGKRSIHSIAKGKDFSIGFILKNEGPGHAFDVYFRLNEATDLEVKKPETYLGDFGPTFIIVEVPVVSAGPANYVVASVEVRWNDFNNTPNKRELLFS